MSNMELKTEYKFVDLYKNNNAVGLTFMITGDKYINTYSFNDPEIRTDDDFVCELWGFRESNNVRTLVFKNEEIGRMINVHINIDGKVWTYGFVKGNFINVDMPDQFRIFQQY